MKRELDVQVQWTAFPLHPETPGQGRSLEEMFAGRGMDIPRMLDGLKRTADELGLPYTPRSMTYNSRRAQELGKWAEVEGAGDAYHHAVFAAYFARGQNIARLEVLREIVSSVNLEQDAVEKVLQEGRYIEVVDKDWRRCRELGITAVPTFRANGRFLVGAQPYEHLKRMVIGTDLSFRTI